MATTIFAAALAAAMLAQVDEPPPLSEAQRARVAELARHTQQEAARLAALSRERQKELAAIYAEYELDADRSAKIEAEILDLQRQMLANYRTMQVELRATVSKERFTSLKLRLDNMLRSPPKQSTAEQREPGAARLSSAPAARAATTPFRLAAQRQPAANEAAAEPSTAEAAEAEPIFSGPQPGEPLPPFRVSGVFGDAAGKEFDLVADAKSGPIVLVVVHEANRPSIALTRVLMDYAATRAKDGLARGVAWLSADPTAAEQALKRMQHALPQAAPLGISHDGQEGPGAYGLNRNVTLTILVGQKGKVTANFALVQPSLQADLPRVLAAIAELVGGDVPDLASLPGMPNMTAPAMRRMSNAAAVEQLRELVRAVIRAGASDEQVDRAAAAVDAHVAKHPAAKQELARMATAVVDGGKLSNYGTPRAQERIRTWADKGDK